MKIQPDAQIAITQKCSECNGKGTTGMRSQCLNCGHDYTLADWEATRARDDQARANGEEMPDTQLCGCGWQHIYEQDVYCAECEGTGTQHLLVSLSDLVNALGAIVATKTRIRAPRRAM